MSEKTNVKKMSGWTWVDSQGDVVSGDDDSETSESSIEVISVEQDNKENDIFHLTPRNVVESADDPSVCENLTTSSSNEDLATQTDCGAILETTQFNVKEKEPFVANDNDLFNINDTQMPDKTFSLLKEQYSYPGTELLNPTSESSLCYSTKEIETKDAGSSVDEMHPPSQVAKSVQNLNKPDDVTDFGLNHLIGACCAELLMEQNTSDKNQEDDANLPTAQTLKNEARSLQGNFLEIALPQPCSPGIPYALENDDNSDSDDFVCLEPERPEEVNVAFRERNQGRVLIPFRISRLSSSINQDFNFIRNAERHHESDDDDRDEDTESSTEDGLDERIESEQSEAGSNQYDNYDVGDLSSFDIGEIPLDVGNVARNYRHQPNTNLTNILNAIVVLSAILTMGISLGITVATDLEIEEWQRAHEIESEKVKTLEAQASTLEKLWNHYKRETKELEELVTLQDKREEIFYIMKMQASDEDKSFHSVLENIQEIRDSYQNCIMLEQLEPESCYSSISPSLARLKTAIVNYVPTYNHKKPDETDTQDIPITFENIRIADNEQHNQVQNKTLDLPESGKAVFPDTDNDESEPASDVNVSPLIKTPVRKQEEEVYSNKLSKQVYHKEKEKDSIPISLDVRQLQQSLTREQERALHWQQLYLSERRQREKERENEEWEDERDRDRWEQRQNADKVDCLQKLMSTNLTTLTQHVQKWNVSVFDDFANLSMLMSMVSELQQSVVSSVHRVWEEAEEVLHRSEKKGAKENSNNALDSFPNKDLTKYFKKFFNDVKEEVEEVLKDDLDYKNQISNYEKHLLKGDFAHDQKSNSKSKKFFGKIANVLKKTKKSVKKIGNKVVGFLGKIHDAWKDRQEWIAKMGSFFSKKKDPSSGDDFEKLCKRSTKNWLSTDINKNTLVNIRSECIHLIRSDWQKKVQKNPCRMVGLCSSKEKEMVAKNNQYSKSLNELFNLKRSIPKKAIRAKYSSISSGMFEEFIQKYAPISLVIDTKWAECSMKWWSNVKNMDSTTENYNNCHWIKIPFFYSDSISQLEIIESLRSWKQGSPVHPFKSPAQSRGKKIFEKADDRNDFNKVNENVVKDDQKMYKESNMIVEFSEKSNNSLKQISSKKEEDSLTIDYLGKKLKKDQCSPKNENTKRNINLDIKNAASGEWHFKKALDRENQRKEEHRSDWLFDRAKARREAEDPSNIKQHRNKNWFLEQGNEREKIRRQDHQADWIFDRANDRRGNHKKKYEKKWSKAKSTKKHFNKNKKYTKQSFSCEDI